MINVKNENNNPIPVEIRPRQVPHFKRIVEILKHEYGYLDVSPCGAGKTHITCAIAQAFKLNLIVICPKSAISTWKKWTKIYGIHIIAIMTYQSLRGQECYDLNHDLLRRVNGEYVSTELFEQCVRSNLLLVFDEYQNLKNENTQLASAHAMVKGLVRLARMGHRARIALLSGTPCVEKESVTSTFKMLGIIQSNKLYNYNRSAKKYELIGIQEAISKCNQYDPDETFAITCRPVNKTTAKTICYDLYTRVLKRFVVSSMPPPDIQFEMDAKNYYVLMQPDDVERLKKGLLLFKSATNYRHEVQEVDLSGVNWGDVTTSRMEIDSAKVPSASRLMINDLGENSHCKVLLFCTYKRDMVRAARLLAKYNPLVMDGSTSEKQRTKIIDAFNADNDNHRVIISNAKVGGVAIELDDKFGNRPRIWYGLPSYFFTDQCQATARVWREGTMSKVKVRFVYSRAFPYETGILHSMATKSEILRNMVTRDHNSIKFPGEYDELLELTPEEIASGVQQNMTINLEENELPEVIDTRSYNQTRKLLEILGKKDRDPLEEDKYHSYSLFIEMVDDGREEAAAVQTAVRLMNENVSGRLNQDLQTVAFNTNLNNYITEGGLIEFVEGFHI